MSQGAAVLPSFSRRSAKVLIIPAVAGAVTMTGFAGAAQAAPVQAAPLPAAPVAAAPVAAAPVATAPAPGVARSARSLSRGSRSLAVLALQRRLGVHPTTGFFGRKTQAAVKVAQRRAQLPATGRVDARTWRAVYASTAAKSARTATRTSASSAARSSTQAVSSARSASSRNYAAYRKALTRAGSRYSWGAEGPRAFDCSGLVMWAYRQVGKSLPHSSRAQRAITRRVSRPAVGDLVFVHRGGGGRVSHVGFYAGNGRWFDASSKRRPVGFHKAWYSSGVSYGRVR